MPQTARLLMRAVHDPMPPAHRPRLRRCGLLAGPVPTRLVAPPPESPQRPPDWRPPPSREGLPRVNRDAAAAQVAGTRYTVEQHARHPCATGGPRALAALRADPDTALAELVAMVEAGPSAARVRARRRSATHPHLRQRSPSSAPAARGAPTNLLRLARCRSQRTGAAPPRCSNRCSNFGPNGLTT
jgi:hypothetical protein